MMQYKIIILESKNDYVWWKRKRLFSDGRKETVNHIKSEYSELAEKQYKRTTTE